MPKFWAHNHDAAMYGILHLKRTSTRCFGELSRLEGPPELTPILSEAVSIPSSPGPDPASHPAQGLWQRALEVTYPEHIRAYEGPMWIHLGLTGSLLGGSGVAAEVGSEWGVMRLSISMGHIVILSGLLKPTEHPSYLKRISGALQGSL